MAGLEGPWWAPAYQKAKAAREEATPVGGGNAELDAILAELAGGGGLTDYAVDHIEIETVGGYDYEVSYNKNGEVLKRTFIGLHQEPAAPADKFVAVKSIGGYDYPVYERPDGTRYTGDEAYGRTADIEAAGGEMTEWEQWQSQYIPYEFEQTQEQEKWQLEQQFAQSQQDYELQKWNLEQQFAQAQQQLDSDLAYQQWQMGYIPHEAQQEYELNKWQLEQQFALSSQNLELQQAQLQQEQANYLAELSTHPRSWLEYSMAAGQAPLVQPWMLPLESGQYPELGGLQAGQPVPGWPTDWSGAEAYAPPIYSPVEMGVEPIAPAPAYTPYTPPTPAPFTPAPTTIPAATPGTPGTPVTPTGSYQIPITATPATSIGSLGSLTAQANAVARTTDAAQAAAAVYALNPNDPVAKAYAEKTAIEKAAAIARAAELAAAGTPLPTPSPIITASAGAERAAAIKAARAAAGLPPISTSPAEASMRNKTKIINPRPEGWPRSMQHGGWVTKPTVAKLAEKEPELVTPLSAIKSTGWQNWGTSPKAREAYTPTNPTVVSAQPTSTIGGGTYLTYEQWLARLGMADSPSAKIRYEQSRQRAQHVTTTTPTTQYSGASALGVNDPYYPLGNIPQLGTPSMQYWARMGPTAQEQYMGYMQAATGITPEELQYRLWSMAPPSGQYSGLGYIS